MASPDDDDGKTTINVKGVRKPAWEAAKREAGQAGDSMGTWLSDAVEQRVSRNRDAVQPPANPAANPSDKSGNLAMIEEQITARMMALAALQQSVAAMKAAGARSNPTLTGARASLERMLPAQPPRLTIVGGKANGKERLLFGQS